MSDVITQAVAQLGQRIAPGDLDFSAKFVIEDEGAIRIDQNGVSADDSDADVTLTADAETFQGISSREVNPAAAVMMGKLNISGDMSLAIKLGSVLS